MAQAGLGDSPQNLTMYERAQLASGLRAQGMPDDAINDQLGFSSASSPEAGINEGPTSRGGLLVPALRNLGEVLTRGAGQALGDQFQYSDSETVNKVGDFIGDASSDLGDWIGGGDVDLQSKLAERQEDRAQRVEDGVTSDTAAFFGEAADMLVTEAPAFAAMIGVGAVTKNPAGVLAISALRMRDETRQRAIQEKARAQYGDNPTQEQLDSIELSPEDLVKIEAVTALQAAPEAFTPLRIASKIGLPVKEAITQSVKKAGVKGLLAGGGMEGATEVAQLFIQEAAYSPELQAKIGAAATQDEIAELGEFVFAEYGREAALSFLVGAGMGGPAGGVTSAIQQRQSNTAEANRQADATKKTHEIGNKAGITTQDFEAIANDPEKTAVLKEAAPQLAEAERKLNRARAERSAMGTDGTKEDVAKADAKLEEAQTIRNEVHDKWIPQLGGKTTAKIASDAKADNEAQRGEVWTRGSAVGLEPKEGIDNDLTLDQQQEIISSVEDTSATRRGLAEKIGRTKSKGRRKKKLKEYRAAAKAEAEARAAAAERFEGKDGTEAKKAFLKQAEDELIAADRKPVVAFQKNKIIEEYPDPGAQELEAFSIVEAAKRDKGERQKKIAKDLKAARNDLKNVTTQDEIDTVQARIGELQAQTSTDTPRVEAARELLAELRPQGDQEVGTEQPLAEPSPTGTAAVEGEAGPAKPKGFPAAAVSAAKDYLSDPTTTSANKLRLQAKKEGRVIAPGDADAIKAYAEEIAANEAGAKLPADSKVRTHDIWVMEEGDKVYTDEYDDFDKVDATPQEAQAWLLKQTEADTFEHSIVLDEDGKVLGVGTVKDDNMVGWSAEAEAAMSDPTRSIRYIHSHPMETPLSSSDLLLLRRFPGMAHMEAVLPSGAIIRARRTGDTPNIDVAAVNAAKLAAHNVASDAGFTVGSKDYAQIAQEALARSLSKLGLIQYNPNLSFPNQKEIQHATTQSDAALTGGGANVEGEIGELAAGVERPGEVRPEGPGSAGSPGTGGGAAHPDFLAEFQAGKPVEELIQHPDFIKVAGEISILPETSDMEGFDTAQWHRDRQYTIDGETVTGTDLAIDRFVSSAKELAAKELGKPVKALKKNKELTIITGPAASGKSTIANDIAYDQGAAILDSDEFKKAIPEYNDGNGANAVHQESKGLAELVERDLAADGVNIVYPKIGHEAGSMNKIADSFKAKGYTVRFVNLKVPKEMAMRRMLGRFGRTGRLITPSYVSHKVGNKPADVHAQLEREGKYDGYAQLDGSGGPGDPLANLGQSGVDALAGTRFAVPGGSPAQRGSSGGAQPSAAGDSGQTGLAQGIDSTKAADVTTSDGRIQAIAVTDPFEGPDAPSRELAAAAAAKVAPAIAARAAAVKGNSKKSDVEAAISSGELDADGIATAIGSLISEAGSSLGDALRITAARLSPDYMASLGGDKRAADRNRSRWENIALQLMNDIADSGEIGPFQIEGKVVRGKVSGAGFMLLELQPSPEMAKVFDVSTESSKTKFNVPMDASDTSNILKTPDVNFTDGPALERAKRTAEVLQGNRYKVIKDRLMNAKPEQMLAGGSLKGGIEVFEAKKRLDRFRRQAILHELDYRRVTDIKKSASLKDLTDYVNDPKNGIDEFIAPIGFHYQIDKKGRIYANGEFHPQAGDAIKKMFAREDGVPMSGEGSTIRSVDHTGSGWQIAAIMARDGKIAPYVNIQGGLAGQIKRAYKRKGPQQIAKDHKGDIYRRAAFSLYDQISSAAEGKGPKDPMTIVKKVIDAQRRVRHKGMLEGDPKLKIDKVIPIDRNTFKTPVVAVNYGGGAGTFTGVFKKLLEKDLIAEIKKSRANKELLVDTGKVDGAGKKIMKVDPKIYTELAAMGEAGVDEIAPQTKALKDWSINNLVSLVDAVERDTDLQPKLEFTVGLDTKYRKKSFAQQQRPMDAKDGRYGPTDETYTKKAGANRDAMIAGEKPDNLTSAEKRLPVERVQRTVRFNTTDLDAAKTARNIFSQIIQGFDATILHEAVQKYRDKTGNDFITTNHDSYSVPEENTEVLSEAVIEAMSEVMGGVDVPARLYEEMISQAEKFGVTEVRRRDPATGRLGALEPIADVISPFVPKAGEPIYNMEDMKTGVPVWIEDDPDAGVDFAEPPLARGIDYEAADTGTVSGVQMPTSLPKSAQFAQDNQFSNNRDFKVALQEQSLAAQKEQGIDLRTNTPDNIDRLADFAVEDAQAALVDNANAVGWYDKKVTAAKNIMAEKHPEILTDKDAELRFIWAVAVTSNGLRVDKNFEIADQVYTRGKNSKKFPTDVGIGEAAKAINNGLDLYNKLSDIMGTDELIDFMTTRQRVGDIEAKMKELDLRNENGKLITVSGEGKNEILPGAVILGPKIGGGFFSNLYGNFDELTMDRWFTRTVGRWRGDLIADRTPQVKKGQARIKSAVANLSPEAMKTIRKMVDVPIRKNMTKAGMNNLAANLAKRSAVPAWRTEINNIPGGTEIRLSGNSLAKDLDGQKEQPSTTVERRFLRDVFTKALDRLKQNPDMSGLTMSDLQALIWYPEKTLYDTSKKPAGTEAKGYDDADAPDYENAARKLVGGGLGQGGRGGRADGGRPAQSGAGGTGSPAAGSGAARAGDGGGVDGGRNTGQQSNAGRDDNGNDVSLDPGLARGLSQPASGVEYEAAMGRSAAAMGPTAGQVSTVPADANVERRLLDGGSTGYALDGDNIIGVFSTPGTSPAGAAQRILEDAVANGGRRLDGFDTFLPKVYAKGGFRAVARLPFDPEYAPSVEEGALADWDADGMEQLGRDSGTDGWAQPDVVFMVYDPDGVDRSTPVDTYEDGMAAQDAALAEGDRDAEPTDLARGIDDHMSRASVKGTPEVVAAALKSAAIAAKTDPGKASATIAGKMADWLEDNISNQFGAVRRLEQSQNAGELKIGMDSAFKSLEVAVNDAGRNESVMLYGAADLDANGAFSTAAGTKGILPIFDMVVGDKKGEARGDAMRDWMEFLIAKRAQDIKAKGMKVPLSDADIQAGLTKGTPEGIAAAAEWKKHNDANIDFMVKSGRISKAQAKALKADANYVPFYRDKDNHADGTDVPELDLTEHMRPGGGSSGVLGGRDPGIKALKGGDKKAIDNLMMNMIKNSQAFTGAGMRNIAATQTLDLMQDAGLATTTRAHKKGKKGNYVEVKKPDSNAVRMFKNGKEVWVVPNPNEPNSVAVMTALAGLQPRQRTAIEKVLGGVGAMFRQSITLSPAFMVRNMIRDVVSTGVLTSGSNFGAASNPLKGMRSAYQQDAATRAFKATTGMGDYNFGNPDIGFGKDDILLDYGLGPRGLFSAPGYNARKLINKMDSFGQITEYANRIAVMQNLEAQGVRADEAAYQALATMNYGRKGASGALQVMLPMIPFLNARIQGLARMAEGATGRRGRGGRKQAMKQLALNGALLMIGSSLILAKTMMDDEDWEKYQDEPLHRRLNYHIIYVGDKTILIPKAFEIAQAFSSIPELIASDIKSGKGEMPAGLRKMVADTFMFNAIPAAMLPIIEGQANYSFFREGSIEGMREKNLRAKDRITNASPIAQFIGRQLGVSDLTKVSPAMIEHYLQGYGGAAYSMLSAVTDIVGADLGLMPYGPEGAFGSVPIGSKIGERVLGSMLKKTDQSSKASMEEFYKTKAFVTQIYRSAKEAATNGDVEYANRLMAQAPQTKRAYTLMNKAGAQMSKLNASIRSLRLDRSLSPQEKEAKLAPLIMRRNNLTSKVSGIIREMEEAQGTTFRAAS